LDCLQTHGIEVKECVEKKENLTLEHSGNIEEGFAEITNNLDDLVSKLPKKDQICETLEYMKDCTSDGLKKCKDPTPENLMTSMLMQVGKGLECKLTESSMRHMSGANVSGGQEAISFLPSLLLIGVFGVFAF